MPDPPRGRGGLGPPVATITAATAGEEEDPMAAILLSIQKIFICRQKNLSALNARRRLSFDAPINVERGS